MTPEQRDAILSALFAELDEIIGREASSIWKWNDVGWVDLPYYFGADHYGSWLAELGRPSLDGFTDPKDVKWIELQRSLCTDVTGTVVHVYPAAVLLLCATPEAHKGGSSVSLFLLSP